MSRNGSQLLHTPINTNGKYEIQIHVEGHWKTIVVDDRIPCLQRSIQSTPHNTTNTASYISKKFKKKSKSKSKSKNKETINETILVPAFARSSTRSELWVSLLEKAIAKHYGSYEAITGGLIHVAMSLLTGGIGQMIKLEQAKKLGHVTNGRLWLRMYNLYVFKATQEQCSCNYR